MQSKQLAKVIIRNEAEAIAEFAKRGGLLPISVLSRWFALHHNAWMRAIEAGRMTELWVDGTRWGVVSEAREEHARLRCQGRAPHFKADTEAVEMTAQTG